MIALESYARRSSARLSSTFVSANAARFARLSVLKMENNQWVPKVRLALLDVLEKLASPEHQATPVLLATPDHQDHRPM